MKLWILRPKSGLDENNSPWEPWYDKAFGFVVRAKTEKQARQIANDHGGNETGKISLRVYRTGGDPWLNPDESTCIELNSDGDEEMILCDFASA
jgi:hypothetical protein